MTQAIAILVYPGFQLLDATGPATVFAEANRALAGARRRPFYTVEMVSAAGGVVESSSGVAVQTRSFARTPVRNVDTLLIAGADPEHLPAVAADPSVRRWAPRCARAGARMGSVCSGAFVLAALGLIDGKRIATHWEAAAPLARTYPSVLVDAEALYVVDGKVWTSAGVAAGIDMALAMVAKDVGAAIAGSVAKRLVLYVRRPGYQSQFSPLLNAQIRADNSFAELIGWIEANLNRPLDVHRLAARANLSERSFHRKFLAATGHTPARFITLIRLDAARMLLSQGLSLKAIAAQVGLPPASRLSAAFERRFGVAPRLFREMHADHASVSTWRRRE